ncbi:hypothetical protein LCGC14_1136360 [marine sediment metagenome]|uniref:Uncharacterized protein n=1 Tax=marine sediment metagenome TaxID=412755 RepID=A0A0F9LZP0_9ZZZZ
MNSQPDYDIELKPSELTIESIINQEYVPAGIKDRIREANLLFIPKIINSKPYFEVETLDLFNYFKEFESEGLKTEICIADEDFQYRRDEAIKEYLVIGWFFLKNIVLKPFINKLKEYLKRKLGKKRLIELKLTIKKTKQTNTVDLEYKGVIDDLDRIFDRLGDSWNE